MSLHEAKLLFETLRMLGAKMGSLDLLKGILS